MKASGDNGSKVEIIGKLQRIWYGIGSLKRSMQIKVVYRSETSDKGDFY